MKTQETIDNKEQLGLDVIASFFAQNFAGIDYKIVPTKSGERYDADVYIGDKRLMIEFKSRSQQFHPKYKGSIIFDLEKISYGLEHDDRYGYFYFSFYPGSNDLYIWNLDRNVHVTENNKDYMEGMPVFPNFLQPTEKNKYGIYWNKNLKISKCTVDANSPTVNRNRIFIPKDLFTHWYYDSNSRKWVKCKNN